MGVAQAQPLGSQDMPPTLIAKENFLGWPNTYRLNNGIIEARILTDVGPRIIDVHPAGGKNLLYVRSTETGQQSEPVWKFRGGWRLWVAPERKSTTYAVDNAPCRVEVSGATVRVMAPPERESGLQKRVDVTLAPGESRLRIVSRLTNVSGGPVTYSPWSLSALRPGGRAFVPVDLGPSEAFDAVRHYILWSYAKIDDPRYKFGNRLIEIDHRKVKASLSGGKGRRDDESKIGVDSTQGWSAYHIDGTLFLKRFPTSHEGRYPDGGATIEVYSSAEFIELEQLGPLTTIEPGDSIAFPEDWWLFPRVEIPSDETAALDRLGLYVEKTAW